MESLGLKMLKVGGFNDMCQHTESDGNVLVTISRRKPPVGYEFLVHDLYGPDEEVIWEKKLGG